MGAAGSVEVSGVTSQAWTKSGVQLSFLSQFFDLCGGRQNLIGKTTQNVVENHITKITERSRSSLCELLRSCRHPSVHDAVNVFVSHAWSSQFLDLIDALFLYFQQSLENVIIWIDIFCVNQHVTFETSDSSLREMCLFIQQINRSVIVFSDWAIRPSTAVSSAMTRTWCLFELWAATLNIDKNSCENITTESRTKNSIEVAMTADVLLQFISDLNQESSSTKILNLLSSSINLAESQTTKAVDKGNLIEFIERQSDASEVNSLLFDRFQRWLHEVTPKYSNNLSQNITYKLALVATLEERGDLARCKELYEEVVEFQRQHLGNSHEETLEGLSNLAIIHMKLGDFISARNLHEISLQGRFKTLGENHPSTLISMHNLACTHVSLNNWQTARNLYEECLLRRRLALGSRQHPDTLMTTNNLALLYVKMGLFEAAHELFEEIYNNQRQWLGARHLKTLDSMNNLGIIKGRRGLLQEAQNLLEECLRSRREILGATHSDTLISMTNLSQIYDQLGQIEKVCEISEETLSINRETLGVSHPETLKSMSSLAHVFWKMGQLERTRQLYSECLEILTNVLGERHQHRLTALNNLASVLAKLNDFEAAARLLEECWQLRRDSLGETHPDTLTSLKNLEVVRKKMARV